MFKHNSQNRQFRERRAALDRTENTGGIDEAVFTKRSPERIALAAQKKQLELQVARLNANLQAAQARRNSYSKERPVDPRTVALWTEQRAQILDRLRDIERTFAEKALQKAYFKPIEKESFSRTFMVMAKELLAEPVYDRLIVATIHRLGEGDDVG